jgi:hypothetical protein
MAEQPPELNGEVGPWDTTREISRTLIGTGRQQSKCWAAAWMAASLSVTVVLALRDAPGVSYAVPLLVLSFAVVAGTHRVIGQEQRSDDGDHTSSRQ